MEIFLTGNFSEGYVYFKVRIYSVQVIAFILKDIKILLKSVMIYTVST